MDSNTSLKKNFILNVLLTLSTILFPLITFPYVSRIIGPAGVGKVTFATSIISYFSMFAQLGIPTYGIRVCARVRDDQEALTRTVHELLVINLVMDILSYAVMILCLVFVDSLQEYRSLLLMMSSTILLTSMGMEWLYRALERYNFITVSSVLFKIAAMILMFMLIHSPTDVYAYGVLSVLAASGSFVLNFLYARKYVSFKLVGNYDFSRHFRPVLVFFAMSCATTIYTNLDTVMLGFIKTDIDVGYYNAAIRVKSLLVTFVTSLGTVLLPRASYYVENNMVEDFKKIIGKSLSFTLIISIPLVAYFICFVEEVIMFLSGANYVNSILPMQILMPTILLIGITNVTGMQMMVPLGLEKQVLISEVLGAIVDLVINIMMIPNFSYVGAAIGTLIAEIIVMTYQLFILRESILSFFKNYNYFKIIITIVAAMLLSIFVKFLNIGYFFKILISGIIFFSIYFICLLLEKEETVCVIFSELLNKVFNKNHI